MRYAHGRYIRGLIDGSFDTVRRSYMKLTLMNECIATSLDGNCILGAVCAMKVL